MMLDFIAYLIILTAIGALILNILRFFKIVGGKRANSPKCGSCTTGCEVKEIHQMLKNKPTNYNQYRMQL